MSGNRSAFEKAMQKGQDCAATNDWARALAEYEKATKEFPNDLSARGNFALALFQIGRWHDAIDEYNALNELMPNNITILDHLSAAYVNVGSLSEAEKVYWDLAQLYVDTQRLPLAIETLERLIQFAPNRLEAHEHLASLYEQKDDGERAAKSYLSLARLHAAVHRWVEATKYCERALTLDGMNSDALKMLEQMRAQREAIDIGIHGQSPLDASEQPALREQIIQLQRSAEELQSLGRYTEALEKYQEILDAGMDDPRIRYSMGLLFQQAGLTERAIGQFAVITGDKEYAVSALYGLGECYETLRQLDSAGSCYEKAISQIDIKTLRRAEMDELAQMHEKAAQCYASLGDPGRAAAIYESLAVILHSKGWSGERADQIRKKALNLTESSIRAKLRQLDQPTQQGTGSGRGSQPLKKETGPLQLGKLGEKATGPLRPITYFLPPIDVAKQPDREPTSQDISVAVEEAPAVPVPEQEEVRIDPVPAVSALPLEEPLDTVAPGWPTDSEFIQEAAGETVITRERVAAIVTDPQRAVIAADQEAINAVAEGLEVDASVAAIAGTGDTYRNSGLYDAALDSYLEAVGQAPSFLPLHFRLAEVYKSQGRLLEAVEKYKTIVALCELRGEPAGHIRACQQLLLLQPRDITLRERLVRSLLDREAYALATVEAGILVEALLASRKHELAVEKAKAIEGFLPNLGWAHLNYGRLLMKLAMYEEARPHLECCLQSAEILAPSLASLTVNLILSADGSGRWEQVFRELLSEIADGHIDHEAIAAEFEVAIPQSQGAELSYCLGKIHALIGKDDEAIAQFESSLDRLSPDAPIIEFAVRTTLVQCLLRKGRAAEAIPHLLACLHLTSALDNDAGTLNSVLSGALSDQVGLYKTLAECYAGQGDPARAVEMLQMAKSLAPADEDVLGRLFHALLDSGDASGAMLQLKAVAEIQEAQGKIRDLEATLRRMIALSPDDMVLREKVVRVLQQAGDHEAAASELETIAEVQARQKAFDAAIRSAWEAARYLWQLGRRERAFQTLEQSVLFIPEPHNAPLRHELINLYLGSKQQDKALVHLQAGVRTAMSTGRTRRAVGYLQRILSLSPNDVFGHFQLALILVRHGEYRQAAKVYGRLIGLQPGNQRLVALREQVLGKAREQEGSPRDAG